jgi:hypothetical protein
METNKIEEPRDIHHYESAWDTIREKWNDSDEWILLNCSNHAVCNGSGCVLDAAFLNHIS